MSLRRAAKLVHDPLAKLPRAVLVRTRTKRRHHHMGLANATQGPGRFAASSTSSTTFRIRWPRSFSGRRLCRQGGDGTAVPFEDDRRDDRFWFPQPCCIRSAGPSTSHAHSNSSRSSDRRGSVVACSRDSRRPITSAPGIVLSAVRRPSSGGSENEVAAEIVVGKTANVAAAPGYWIRQICPPGKVRARLTCQLPQSAVDRCPEAFSQSAAKHALEADGARRLRNESFFSAPQLKRDSLGSTVTEEADHALCHFLHHSLGCRLLGSECQCASDHVRSSSLSNPSTCVPLPGPRYVDCHPARQQGRAPGHRRRVQVRASPLPRHPPLHLSHACRPHGFRE